MIFTEYTKYTRAPKESKYKEVKEPILNDFVGDEEPAADDQYYKHENSQQQQHQQQQHQQQHQQQQSRWRIRDENWPAGKAGKTAGGHYYNSLPWESVRHQAPNDVTYRRWDTRRPQEEHRYNDRPYYHTSSKSTRDSPQTYEPVTYTRDQYRQTEPYDRYYDPPSNNANYQSGYYGSQDQEEDPTERYYQSDYHQHRPVQTYPHDQYYQDGYQGRSLRDPHRYSDNSDNYYRSEGQERPARVPEDEYYYDQNKRPQNVPPNVYLYGEGPGYPSEVPSEMHGYSPKKRDRSKHEQLPVVETEVYESSDPNAPRKKKQKGGDIKERGYAPKPFQGAFPGIPKDDALRRFQLRNGWVIEIIIGGFRAIKDERKINGWKHVYARIYEEAPDGSAGHSVWMFQSEYDSRFQPKRTGYRDQRPYKVRNKRGVSRAIGRFDKSPLFSSEPSMPWPGADKLDEIYGEPVAKPSVRRQGPRIQADTDMIAPPQGNGPPRRPRPATSNAYMYMPHGRGQGDGPVKTTTVYRARQPEGRVLNRRPQITHTVTETHDKGDNHHEDSFFSETDVFHNTGPRAPRRPEFPPSHLFPQIPDKDSSSEEDDDQDGVENDLDIDRDVGFDDHDDVDDDAVEDQEVDDENDDHDTDTTDNVREDDNAEDDVSPHPSHVCHHHPETGPCRAYIRRWYYDSRKHQCSSFIFGGCRGNPNNFPTREDCMRSCAPSIKGTPLKSYGISPDCIKKY